MSKFIEYKANDLKLIEAYLAGKKVYFNCEEDKELKEVYPYMIASDIHRLTYEGYTFYVEDQRYTPAVITLSSDLLKYNFEQYGIEFNTRDPIQKAALDAVCQAYYQGGIDAAEYT